MIIKKMGKKVLEPGEVRRMERGMIRTICPEPILKGCEVVMRRINRSKLLLMCGMITVQ